MVGILTSIQFGIGRGRRNERFALGLIKQQDSPQASLPAQTIECDWQVVCGSRVVVDYNQIIEHGGIVINATKPIVIILSSPAREFLDMREG